MARSEVDARAREPLDGRYREARPSFWRDLSVREFLHLWDADRDEALRWYGVLVEAQLAMLCHNLRRRDVAEDILQEGFLAAFGHDAAAVRRAPGTACMAGWHWGLLRTLVQRRCVQRTRRVEAYRAWARHGRPTTEAREPDEEPGPCSPHFSSDDWDRILRPLVGPSRRCLALRLAGVSFRGIAKQEGISVRTARRRVCAATETIKHDAFFT